MKEQHILIKLLYYTKHWIWLNFISTFCKRLTLFLVQVTNRHYFFFKSNSQINHLKENYLFLINWIYIIFYLLIMIVWLHSDIFKNPLSFFQMYLGSKNRRSTTPMFLSGWLWLCLQRNQGNFKWISCRLRTYHPNENIWKWSWLC